MKLGVMPGDTVPAAEWRTLGFEAMQFFYGFNRQDDAGDPTAEEIDARLKETGLSLAAMTLHIDLVGPQGAIQPDIDRAVRMVARTAGLKGSFGDNKKPIMIWHPSGYPDVPGVNDQAVFQGLCSAMRQICAAAEKQSVHVAVEMSRACSVYSAETFLRIKDQVASPALKVCIDAANIVPDRTPLERCIRMLAGDIVIAHGKDSHFNPNGDVAEYGPTGSGKLDYATYLRCLRDYCQIPYFILEYYKTREDLLRARDIVRQHM